MPKLVCVRCKKQLIIEKNGIIAQENAPFGPYKIWETDKWKCPECEYEVLAGFGQQPISEHYLENFKIIQENIDIEFL